MLKNSVQKKSLAEKYPPSEPCSCEICVNYCNRPGWWTVEEAGLALDSGYGKRMMLELAPELTFGVLSPAFKGCEGNFALNEFSKNGCNFFKNSLCELFGTGIQPLECRFCHHDRHGEGEKCHLDIENEWHSQAGYDLIERWIRLVDFPEASYYRMIITSNRK